MAAAIDPRSAWEAYVPSDQSPWDEKKVGHLYRRASFGATHAELQAGLKLGPEKLVDALLKGGEGREEFEKQTSSWGKTVAEANNGPQLRGWWLYRMLYSPHPAREKLTLFWHNHFATSNAKVQNVDAMLGQYELMYRHAQGSFRELLTEMSEDPAMMIWLDTRASKKGNPNENYARELMELFSLGVGNYTEKDIREAARAFTGWEVEGAKGVFKAGQHDDGEKTVLGQTGKWQDRDIVRICLEQRSAPTFLTTKLVRFLVSESAPITPEVIEPLAAQFRQSDYDFGALVKTILRSNLFFSADAYRSSIKSPVEFSLGIVRGLEGHVRNPKIRFGFKPLSLSQALEGLGQSLFYPPSVKGWDGGRTWLNAQTLLFRQNLALSLTSTQDDRFGRRTDPAFLAEQYGLKSDEQVVDFLLRVFLQKDVPAASRATLLDYLAKARKQTAPVYWPEGEADAHRVRAVCHLVLTLPEFQLN
jgi:uncharacterized protein (DUF1800 family)